MLAARSSLLRASRSFPAAAGLRRTPLIASVALQRFPSLPQQHQDWQPRRSISSRHTKKDAYHRRLRDLGPGGTHRHLSEADREYAKIPRDERRQAMIERLQRFADGEEVENERLSLEDLEAAEEHILKDVHWDRYQRALEIADANFFGGNYTYEENVMPPHEWESSGEGVRAQRLNRETELEQLKFLAQMRYFLVVDRRRHVTITPSGRSESYSAMVVAGNGKGAFGYAHCRGVNADEAETKCLLSLHKNMIFVPLFENRTLFYDVVGKHRQTKIKMQSVRRGHAYRACPMIYYMARCVGFKDLTTKVIGSRNKYQVVKAFINSLLYHTSDREDAIVLGKNIYEMFDPATYKPPRPTPMDVEAQVLQARKHVRQAHEEWKRKMQRRELAGLTAEHYEAFIDGAPDHYYKTLRPSDWVLPRAPAYVEPPQMEGSRFKRPGHDRKSLKHDFWAE